MCHEHDLLGTTLWTKDLSGNTVGNYRNTTAFGEGEIQADRAARFTGKPYDNDLKAYVFLFRIYDPSIARWRSSDPSGYPDGINQHLYVFNPISQIDIYGLEIKSVDPTVQGAINNIRNSSYGKDPNSVFNQLDNRPGDIEVKAGDRSTYNHIQDTVTVSEKGDGMFAARDSDGNLTNTTGSLESKIVHELTHKYDYQQDPEKYLNNRNTPGENGSNVNEDSAMEEGNKYRESVGEMPRIWYNDLNDYLKHHEK